MDDRRRQWNRAAGWVIALAGIAALYGITRLPAASTSANTRLHTRVATVDAAGVAVTPRLERGLATPQADVTVNEAWETAIAIPAGTAAIRVYTDQLVYCVPNATAGNPATGGAPITPGAHHEIGCYGATHLHWGKVSANAAVKWSSVSAVAE